MYVYIYVTCDESGVVSMEVRLCTDVGRLGMALGQCSNLSQRCSNGVRALCGKVKFFHTDLDKPFLFGPRFVHGGIIKLKPERASHKLLTQS